jgi:lipid II:glycine glycyltransferase (peptidoglycan interpeptide bridge formation enzyme)
LAARGVSRYDFGGVDRVLNKGVFDFKHGAGGIDHTYNGEFETAVPRLVKSLVSKLVSFRLSA